MQTGLFTPANGPSCCSSLLGKTQTVISVIVFTPQRWMLPWLCRRCLISFACALWLLQAAAAVCCRPEPSDVLESRQTTTHPVSHRTGLHSQRMHTSFSVYVVALSQASFGLDTSLTESSSCLIWNRTLFLLSRNPDGCKWDLMRHSTTMFYMNLFRAETDWLMPVLMVSLCDCLVNLVHIYLISKHHGNKQTLN